MLPRSAKLALLGAPAFVLPAMAFAPTAAAAENYTINLSQLNRSGVTGTVDLTVDGNRMTVQVDAHGLVPGQPHAQHLHGALNSTDFHCPTMAADANGDGVVTTSEGLPAYGDILISLTTKGDTSKDSGLAVDRMPVADDQGNLSYERTITLDDQTAANIQHLHYVTHGLDSNGNGKYDFSLGKSDLDPTLPEEATDPVACGEIDGAAAATMPSGGVDTGSGSTSGVESMPLLGFAGLALAGGAGLTVAARRRQESDKA